MQKDPFQEVPPISPINPDATQFLTSSPQMLQEELGSCWIGNGGRGDHNGQKQSKRVDEDVAFAPFHPLATVISPHASNLCRFDALAIKCSSRWVLMAMGTLSD